MSYSEEGYVDDSQAMDKTNLPGVFLIMVGIINAVAALVLLYNGYQMMQMPDEDFRKQWEATKVQQPPDRRKQFEDFEKQGYTAG